MTGPPTKTKKEAEAARLELQADAILEKDREERWLQEIAALRECYEQLRKPSDDPEYLQRLKDVEAQRNAIANKIQAVHIVPDKLKTWIAVGLTNPNSKADAHDIARRMGEHFEARVISHDDPNDLTRFVDRPQRQPPRHLFGRSARSKPK
jgi:hypothetical protein